MYYLSECLIIRDENQYLVEHLTKGVQSGIEHFFVYDNMSEVSVEDFLKDYPELFDKCTIEKFASTDRTQYDCYKKFLKDHREDTVWCAFIDTDEMFEGNLIALCKANEEYACIRMLQIMHGANNNAYADFSKTLTERCQSHIITKIQMQKCISQVKYISLQYPHFITAIHKFPLNKWMKNIGINETCQLHHYFYRGSFEEWLQKVKRGNVLSVVGWKVNTFFQENSISDKDKDALLEQYGLVLDSKMKYAEKKI